MYEVNKELQGEFVRAFYTNNLDGRFSGGESFALSLVRVNNGRVSEPELHGANLFANSQLRRRVPQVPPGFFFFRTSDVTTAKSRVKPHHVNPA